MGRSRNTDDGQVKGKVVYMAPEQMGKEVDLRADLWAAGAVLWEMLAGRRLFVSMTDALGYHTNNVPLERPSVVGRRETPLDDVAMRALSRDPAERYQTAREMIVAIERAVPPAPARRVSVWTQRLAEEALAKRSALVAEVEAYQPASLAATVAADVVGPPRARSVVPLVAAVLGALAFAAALGVLVLRPGGRGPAKADNGPPSVASAASVSLPGSVALPASATAPPSGAMTAAAPSGSPAGSPSPSSSSPSAEASSGVTAGALRARKVRGHGAASAARTTESDPAPPVIAVPSLPAVDAGDPRELNRRK
jgi:serine/threonine-protein kinase